jgi:hypothetical protein
MLKSATVAALLALAAGALPAQTMYRCGNSYGHEPCPGATLVQAAQRPSDAEARQAESAAQKDQRRADAMEKARLAQEARAPKALIIGGTDKPAEPQAAQGKPKDKGKKPEHFTATSPKPPGEAGGKKKKS